MHTDLTDLVLADMNGDGRLDAVGPTDPESVGTGVAAPLAAARPAAAAVSGSGAAAAPSAPGVSVLVNTAVPRAATLTVARTGSGAGRVDSAPAGIRCGSDCAQTYPRGTVVTLTAAASAGSAFRGWVGACTGTAPCRVTMTGARSVTAVFSRTATAPLTVLRTGAGRGAVSSQPGGITCGSDCSESYALGTVVTLSARAAGGSAFLGWAGPCSGRGTCQVTVSAATTVTARFAAARAVGAARVPE